MKKLFFLAGIILMIGCSKDSPSADDPNTRPDISPLPSRFSQNVFVEFFTQTTCGQCPKTDFIIDSLIELYPGRIIPAAIHVNDILSDTLLEPFGNNVIGSFYNITGTYPAGMINRKVITGSDPSIDNWYSNVQSTVSQVPSCGIALEAKNVANGQLTLTVHLGFKNSLVGEYRLNGFIVEESVIRNDTAYAQLNDYSFEGATPDTTLPFYALNDTIFGFQHRNVLRKVLSDPIEGDIIPVNVMTGGTEFLKTYSINLNGLNVQNCSVIVFIDKYAPESSGHRIQNVQKVRIGESQDWN